MFLATSGCPNQTPYPTARSRISGLSLSLLHLHTPDKVMACPKPQRILAMPGLELGLSGQAGPMTPYFLHQGCRLPQETGTRGTPQTAPISIQQPSDWA